ncbi:Fc receptor-like protein 5 isoform 1-T1 [Salvelinus alpinus]|uniref:Fc receptor-like protein 5 isoform X1 n=1 Tax=Salvelinus alpinus TaxID=8036 RepID=UPI0039FC51CB
MTFHNTYAVEQDSMEHTSLWGIILLSALTCYGQSQEPPRAVLTLQPKRTPTGIYQGETVTLRCDIQEDGVTDWEYRWYRSLYGLVYSSSQNECSLSPVELSHNGVYSCMGVRRSNSQKSSISEDVTLTVSWMASPHLTMSPSWWANAGDSVTLSCEVGDSSTGWRFSWYKAVPYREGLPSYPDKDFFPELLPDSDSGAGGTYSLSLVGLNHRERYVCRAERGDPVYYTDFSELKFLWVEGRSPSAFLTVSPNRVQFFYNESVSLGCAVQGDSNRWRVKRYLRWEEPKVLECPTDWGSVTGSTCIFTTTDVWSDTGVYWCESESGEYSNAVNITVTLKGVALESPALPVTEGDSVTLRCRYQGTPSNLSTEFHKWMDNGYLTKTELTGEMTIPAATQSDEGWYRCKQLDQGESHGSWVSVRAPDPVWPISLLILLCSLLVVSIFLLVTIALVVKCCRARAARSRDKRNDRNATDQVISIELT